MQIERLNDVIELKNARDRLDSIIWRCRNIGDGRITVLLPALRISLPDGSEVQMPEEGMDVTPGAEEQAILKRTEEQAMVHLAEVDAALAALGVEVSQGETGLRALPPAEAAPAAQVDAANADAAPAAAS